MNSEEFLKSTSTVVFGSILIGSFSLEEYDRRSKLLPTPDFPRTKTFDVVILYYVFEDMIPPAKITNKLQ